MYQKLTRLYFVKVMVSFQSVERRGKNRRRKKKSNHICSNENIIIIFVKKIDIENLINSNKNYNNFHLHT